MLTALDNMALSFADAFNAVHEKGKTYTGEQGAAFLTSAAVKRCRQRCGSENKSQ